MMKNLKIVALAFALAAAVSIGQIWPKLVKAQAGLWVVNSDQPSGVVQWRVFGRHGSPATVGRGTALPTVANSGAPPVDGEMYVVTAAATAPALRQYDSNAVAWRTVMVNTLATADVGSANSIWFSSNTINFEGATADASEFLLVPIDPTADMTFNLQNWGVAGTTQLLTTGVTPAHTVETVDNGAGATGQEAQQGYNFKKMWFRSYPPVQFVADTGGAACSVTGNPNYFMHGSEVFASDMKGSLTDCEWTWTAAAGIAGPGDAADNEGFELVVGGEITASNPYAFIPNTDAFYFRVRIDQPTVANTDQMYIGFRQVAAFQATDLEAYSDYALIGIGDLSDGGAGDFFQRTEIGGGGVTATDLSESDWTDGQIHTLDVIYAANGDVTFQVEGAAAGGAVAFNHTGTTAVIPIVWVTSDNTAADPVTEIRYVEVGYGTP